jgi:hypothetical protein
MVKVVLRRGIGTPYDSDGDLLARAIRLVPGAASRLEHVTVRAGTDRADVVLFMLGPDAHSHARDLCRRALDIAGLEGWTLEP